MRLPELTLLAACFCIAVLQSYPPEPIVEVRMPGKVACRMDERTVIVMDEEECERFWRER